MLTPEQLNDLTDSLATLNRTLNRGLGADMGDLTPLHGIAISLKGIREDMLSIVCALERIADAQEKARTV